LHLRAERTAPYQKPAGIMSAAQSAGVMKIGFITDPKQKK